MKTRQSKIIDSVSDNVRAALGTLRKSGGPLTETIRTIAQDVMRRAVDDGTDLSHAANGFMLGVLSGTKEARKDILDTIRQTACVAMEEAGAVGGSLEEAALGLLAGAIHGAKEFKLEVQGASSAATDGVLKAAETAIRTKVPSSFETSGKPCNHANDAVQKPGLTSLKQIDGKSSNKLMKKRSHSQPEKHRLAPVSTDPKLDARLGPDEPLDQANALAGEAPGVAAREEEAQTSGHRISNIEPDDEHNNEDLTEEGMQGYMHSSLTKPRKTK
jgi:hypothetical protein